MAQASNPAETKQIVQKLLGGWSSGDRVAIRAALRPDAEWWAPQSAVIAGFPVPLTGADTIADRIALAAGGYVTLSMKIEDVVAEGDRAAAMLTLSGVRKEGQKYENRYILMFRLQEGLISHVFEATDTAHTFRVRNIGGQT